MPVTSAAPVQPATVTEIERLGFRWSEVAQFDLSSLSVDRRIQVRETSHYAPRDAVERFAVQMAHSVFPPIVVTSDGWIVDGNTRVGAALAREQKFYPAMVIAAEFAGRTTTAKQKNEMYALAATLNANHGTPLTSRETREVVSKFIALDWKAEQIARAIGLRPASVTAVKREITAAAKLTRVGMDANGSLRGASLRALGSTNAIALNDIPYRSLATLAGDAGLNVSEINSAITEARKMGSDTEQQGVLEALRVEMGDRIKNRELTGASKPPMSRQLRQHLGFVTKFAGHEQELLETDPKVNAAHVEALRASVAVLSAVLDMQGSVTS